MSGTSISLAKDLGMVLSFTIVSNGTSATTDLSRWAKAGLRAGPFSTSSTKARSARGSFGRVAPVDDLHGRGEVGLVIGAVFLAESGRLASAPARCWRFARWPQ